MGFKFKRFSGKLIWKKKQFTPEVVCLRYFSQSEFTEPLSPPKTETKDWTDSIPVFTTLTPQTSQLIAYETNGETQKLKGILKKAAPNVSLEELNEYSIIDEEDNSSPLILATQSQSNDEKRNVNWQNIDDESPLSNRTVSNAVASSTDNVGNANDSGKAYSSQASSIFFEEKPPIPRPRLRIPSKD
uniref:Uncharacterized protein n=1 Tax=Photinus pyralis TaxID=7054 RepID=A0A1Y1NFB1_PHOPY